MGVGEKTEEDAVLINPKLDRVRKMFGPLREKSLKNALAHVIGRDFPRIGGDRIRVLCAEMILEVVAEHLRPREHLRHGQVLWLGVDVNDPPARSKRIADTHLIPVILDVSTTADVEARLNRTPAEERLQAKAIRLCEQAYQQGALLSNADLAELMTGDASRIASALVRHERKTGKVIPRRATVHDVGCGITHKRIICWKRYAEGKSSDQVARETYHTVEAVDRYLGQFDRVRHCRTQGMTPAETAYALNCSPTLVEEYLQIDRELKGAVEDARGNSGGQECD
jgi:DNA-binding CsgD family transcriptional regulator